MNFSKLEQIVESAKTVRDKHQGVKSGVRYPVLFKRATCVYLKGSSTSIQTLSLKIGVTTQTVNTWVKQHSDGLYTVEGACSVSSKTKAVNDTLIKQLRKEVDVLQLKIDLIVQCEALGLKVA